MDESTTFLELVWNISVICFTVEIVIPIVIFLVLLMVHHGFSWITEKWKKGKRE